MLMNLTDIQTIISNHQHQPALLTQYNVPLLSFNQIIKEMNDLARVEFAPDFQRGHIWTREQRIAYLEALFSNGNAMPISAKTIVFNQNTNDESLLFGHICIDGLQRLTSLNAFVKNKFKLFNNQISYQDLINAQFITEQHCFVFQIHQFEKLSDVLQFYLKLNHQNPPTHSIKEIQRIQNMLQDAQQCGV